jgi:hypothetical protein
MNQGDCMDEQLSQAPEPLQPTLEMREEFTLLMSLALDGLLDASEQQRFDAYLTRYAAFAEQWRDWQHLHQQMIAAPHVEPQADFVGKVGLCLLQQGRRRRLWQGALLAFLLATLWIGLVATVLGLGAFFLLNQGNWLSSLIQSLAQLSSSTAISVATLRTSLAQWLGSPQVVALCLGYLTLDILLLSGWFRFLRQTTADPEPVSVVS